MTDFKEDAPLTFSEEWNLHSGASKTLGAGSATGALACAAALQYVSSYLSLQKPLMISLIAFLIATPLFCVGFALLYFAYLSRDISRMQLSRWIEQEDEALALMKIGHQRTEMRGDVTARDSFRSLNNHHR